MKQIISQTKIIATLGPATSSKNIISDLITSGVDVFRLNFSHSSKEEYLRLVILIKERGKPARHQSFATLPDGRRYFERSFCVGTRCRLDCNVICPEGFG